MSDGIREELRELLFDSAPPPEIDREALFARTFASEPGAGADLLPPDGLFDLPGDDPADEALLDADGTPTDADDPGGTDDLGDPGVEPDTDAGTDLDPDVAGADGPWGDPAAGGDPAGAPDVPFEPGAGW
jgi:hypothetical protein